MTTQVMFKIEERLKKAAQKKAKEEGITLSDLYHFATKSYIEGSINIGLTFKEESLDEYTKGSRISFKKGLADIKAGRYKRVR